MGAVCVIVKTDWAGQRGNEFLQRMGVSRKHGGGRRGDLAKRSEEGENGQRKSNMAVIGESGGPVPFLLLVPLRFQRSRAGLSQPCPGLWGLQTPYAPFQS